MKYPHLFSPITLGSTVFKNRIFASPISQRTNDTENRPTPEGVAFYARKARGGAASVCLGDCIVDSEYGMYGPEMLKLDDMGAHREMNRVSEAISRHGAVASVELQHAGIYSNVARAAGKTVYGPVDGELSNGGLYFEMPEEQILRTIDKFAAAAAWAKSCGFGMVTIHGGHGWLLSQFMSPMVNTRRDKWGGSLENRMRLPIAIADAIKAACGKAFPVEIRISGSEVTPRGYDIDEGIEIAKALDGHVDLIHVSAGHHEYPEVFCVTHPSIFARDSENVRFAAEIKKHVKTPVATVGAHCDPELMEEIIASGQADVIEAARALLADPDLPKKARAGKAEDIRPCLRCLQCFSGLITNGQIYCAVNPEIGNEIEYRDLKKTETPKRVAIAGGGIGGMQAAITLAKRGHDVTLFENSEKLGGALRCEENVPFKGKINAYIAYQERQIASLPIDVRLNTAATAMTLAELSPDALIAAVGAVPLTPPIPGIERALFAEKVYEQPELAQGKIAVLGGGLVGQELAIYLVDEGRSVTIIEMAPALNSGGNILHQNALNVELKSRGVDVMTGTRALEITDMGVLCAHGDEELEIDADTVICAVGQKPQAEQAYALRDCAPEFYVIGDCISPKNITQATAQAEAAAREI